MILYLQRVLEKEKNNKLNIVIISSYYYVHYILQRIIYDNDVVITQYFKLI